MLQTLCLHTALRVRRTCGSCGSSARTCFRCGKGKAMIGIRKTSHFSLPSRGVLHASRPLARVDFRVIWPALHSVMLVCLSPSVRSMGPAAKLLHSCPRCAACFACALPALGFSSCTQMIAATTRSSTHPKHQAFQHGALHLAACGSRLHLNTGRPF